MVKADMGPGCAALVQGQGMLQEGTLPCFSAPEGGEARNPVVMKESDGRSWAGGRVSHGDQIFRMNHRGPSLFTPHSTFRPYRGQTERASTGTHTPEISTPLRPGFRTPLAKYLSRARG